LAILPSTQKQVFTSYLPYLLIGAPTATNTAVTTEAREQMAAEKSRTLDVFETLRTVASPSPSPFHGWGDEYQIEPVQQSGHAHSRLANPLPQARSPAQRRWQSLPPPLYRQPSVPLRNAFHQLCGPPQADRLNVFGNQQLHHGQPANQQQQIQFPPNFGFGVQVPQHGVGQQLYGGQQLQYGGLQQQYPAYNQFQQGGVGAGPANPDPGQRAQPGPTQATASVVTLRGWFPFLTNMPDEMLVATDLVTLIALQNSLQPTVQRGSSDPMSVASQAAEMWAAAAARISSSLQKPDEDPAIMMAKTLESLRSNPVAVATGLDDRCTILHPARFLGGSVSAKALWRAAREVIGLNGVPPLSNYDMTCMGLGGCVTMRGWKEMANLGSPHNTLKLYSSSNMSSSTGATRRLSLADGSQAVNIGENLKEVTDLAELKLAVRTMCRAAQLILPWNMAYNAIDGFLHSSNYGMAGLNGRANRATILTEFINYVLGLNAAAWIQKEDFLTSGEIKTSGVSGSAQGRPACCEWRTRRVGPHRLLEAARELRTAVAALEEKGERPRRRSRQRPLPELRRLWPAGPPVLHDPTSHNRPGWPGRRRWAQQN
jgi:hypothetical protein